MRLPNRFVARSTLAVFCAVGIAVCRDASDERRAPVDFKAVFALYDSARSAEGTGDARRAARAWLGAGRRGFEARQAYMSAMAWGLEGGDTTVVVAAMEGLAGAGLRDLRPFRSDPRLRPVRRLGAWPRFEYAVRANKAAHQIRASDPTAVRIETSDVDRFWAAYDAAAEAVGEAERESIYREQYFQAGSRGLRDFTFMKMRTGIGDFTSFVESHRPYYDAVRAPSREALERLRGDLSGYLADVQRLVPGATFPDFTFVVGRHTSFGSASLAGSIIAVENVVDENVPVWTLPPGRQEVVAPTGLLPFVLIHELFHTYQMTTTRSVLGAVLMEGGADFLTELAVGPPVPEPKYREFGRANEMAIWDQFLKEMDDTNTSHWIGSLSPGDEPLSGWTRDVGYWVGYRIAQAYFDQSLDKQQAITDLLDLEDPTAILSASGYQGGRAAPEGVTRQGPPASSREMS